jgi:hypothetical protein
MAARATEASMVSPVDKGAWGVVVEAVKGDAMGSAARAVGALAAPPAVGPGWAVREGGVALEVDREGREERAVVTAAMTPAGATGWGARSARA